MTFMDPVRAAVTAAETFYEDALAELTHNETALTADLNAANAEVARLTKRVAELEALVPVPTRWGVNTSEVATSTARQAAMKVEAIRYFHQPGEGIYYPPLSPKTTDRVTLKAGQVFIYSPQVPLAEQAAGQHDAAWLACFRAAPKDRPFYACPRHEPEDDPDFTVAAYRDTLRRVYGLARQVGPHIKVGPILMGYSAPGAGSGRNWLDYYPGDAYCDFVGWDVYAWNANTDPSTMYAKVLAAMATRPGKRYLIAETGIDNVAFTGQARLDALTKASRALAAADPAPLVVCYFDNWNWQITNDPASVTAWQAGQD